MSKTRVSIVKTMLKPEYPEIRRAVEKALDLIGGIQDLVKPGSLVLIKPSWVSFPVEREAACITLPEVTRAIAEITKGLGGAPVIAESSAIGVDTEKVIRASGYEDLRNMGYEVVNLEKTKSIRLPVPHGRAFKSMPCWEIVQRADVIISVPKLKTHDQTEITCAIKNLKGLQPDKGKKNDHRKGLFDAVPDLLAVVKPQLAVVDAILCQEGVGPMFGRPVEMDLILAGRDLVAVDSTCGRLIGYDPREVRITVNSAERGLGIMDPARIDIVGEPLESVKRRFMRSYEDEQVKVDGFQLIYGEITCTGCRNTILSSLLDMKNADQLCYLPGVTVVAGDAPLPEGIPRESIVTIGNCMRKNARTRRHVRGCPPNCADVVKGIIGDRAESKSRYATDYTAL